MTTYAPPVDDYLFLLHQVLHVQARDDIAGFPDLEPDLTRQILEGAGAFLSEVWQPLNRIGDEEGCRLENGVVRTPTGFGEAYRSFCDAGWNRLGAPERFGGAGLPGVISQAISEMGFSANASLSHYPGLTNGAASSLMLTGAPWMLQHVVPRMVSGEWCGTMCLTEPHCGTDLRLMTTRAVAQADGSYRITGAKIFISGGDHDLTDNIVHLVLAKLPDEAGRYSDDLASVNLFMVPKVLVDPETGAVGAHNGVSVGGLEAKMGLKGSATCVLNFDDAVGYRLGTTKAEVAGSKSAGMSGMFHMMNHARLGTGLAAVAAAEVAYQNSALYAQERRSGRAVAAADRSEARADPIIVHPDVRRMLLQQRAFVEGGRAAALWVAELLHEEHAGAEPLQRRRAAVLGQLLTPVVKAYFSDRAFEATNLAVQVFGGHGYIRENGAEQFVRDARIFQLYEGANGIQAFDLVARKLPLAEGAAVNAFLEEVLRIAASAEGRSSKLKAYGLSLRRGAEAIEDVVAWLRQTAPGRGETLGSASYDVLNLFGLVLLAALWLRMAVVAEAQLAAGEGDPTFLRRKLVLARYWFEREMPAVDALVRRAQSGADGLMALAAEAF